MNFSEDNTTDDKFDFGDYVWFRLSDDVFSGTVFSNVPEFVAGIIMKKTHDSLPPLYWISTVPVHDATLALWAIPKSKVIAMTAEDAMLQILENT